MKKLSIITICYNEPNLERTCESIVNQTWQDFEWIVVDGGSNDETQKIWDKYKYRIDKFISEPDNGIYNACNKGINLANGKYISFMNAGDSFYTKDILKQVFCDKNFKADVLYGDTCKLKGRGKTIVKKPKISDKKFFIIGNICTQSAFIKRDLFLQYGCFDEKYTISSDREAWIKFIKNGAKFKHVGLVVSNFDGSGLSSTNIKLRRQENNSIVKNYYTKEEIINEKERNSRKKLPLRQKIFSKKKSKDKRHWVVMILGVCIKIKRKRRNK